jgi:feruloyl-CoA synthase
MTHASSTAPSWTMAPVRDVRIWNPEVTWMRTAAGVTYVRPVQELGAYPDNLLERLEHWASVAPERVFLAQRDRAGDWRTLTYAQTRAGARNIAQALLDRGLSVDRPVTILSGNDLEHAQLGLGAMYAGIPYAPISPAYSLISSDFGKLRHIIDLLTPGLVFVSDAEPFRKAMEAVIPVGAGNATEIVTANAGAVPFATTPFHALAQTNATNAVVGAYAGVGPDTIAKILFTSGSTGSPKGVINTQRMLASNQQLVRSVLLFAEDEPPILCDWLPWNHTFAGNHDFGFVLYNGGSYYIDEGRPVPGGMEATVRNLDDVRPTVFLNVPRGFEALLPFLRERPEFRRRFFSRLKLFYYAGASLSQPVWDELQQLAVETCGERILVFTGLGSTETAPAAFFPGKEIPMAGFVGVPAPGVELKLVPAGEKLEMRLRGPGITPGYWRQPELTAAVFDEEGYYRIGDALRFYDPADPGKGFVFDGRIAEDFKLATGTWVSVGPLRARFLERCQPFAHDVVIAGHDRDDVTALIIPNVDVCRGLCPELPGHAPATEVLASLGVRAKFESLLRELAVGAGGSSNRIARALLLETPPSIDAHEITDKGSLNQGAILRNRVELVEELYAPAGSPRVIVI